MKLIQINPTTIVHPDNILEATRMGNYTEILLKNQQPWNKLQIWDDTKELWSKIEEATQ